MAGLPAAAAARLFHECVPHDRDADTHDEQRPGILIGESEDPEIDRQEPDPRQHVTRPRSGLWSAPRVVELGGARADERDGPDVPEAELGRHVHPVQSHHESQRDENEPEPEARGPGPLPILDDLSRGLRVRHCPSSGRVILATCEDLTTRKRGCQQAIGGRQRATGERRQGAGGSAHRESAVNLPTSDPRKGPSRRPRRRKQPRCGRFAQQRYSEAPQLRPLPSPTKQTRSPGFARPACRASWNAIGIVAAVVFPYFWMLLKTFASDRPSFFWTASLIRRFAWCMTSRSRSSSVRRFASRMPCTASGIRVTAVLNTSRPSTIGTMSPLATISGLK